MMGGLREHNDEEIGRFVRQGLDILDRNYPSNLATISASALIDQAIKSNADSLSVSLYGLTKAEEERGDWEVSVRRLPKWRKRLRAFREGLETCWAVALGRWKHIPADEMVDCLKSMKLTKLTITDRDPFRKRELKP